MRIAYSIPLLIAAAYADEMAFDGEDVTWVDGAEGTNGKVQWRQAVDDGRWFLWMKATTMLPEKDTIAKMDEGVSLAWYFTNDANFAGTDVEAWNTEKKDGKPVKDKWYAYLDTIANNGNNSCFMELNYNGYKDAEKGTTNRALNV